jgi:hypothetical protein
MPTTATRVIRAGRNFCKACEERFEIPGSEYCAQCHADISASLAQADENFIRDEIYRDEIRSKYS